MTTRLAVEAELERYGGVWRPAVPRYLPEGGASPYLLDPVADYVARPGKGLRPALCMATCEAFGGSMLDALPSAVAIELLHTAFLVHDDLADGSELRRGEPTLHLRYGTPLALNAGDALAMYGLAALRENRERLGPAVSDRIASEFEFMARQTVEGQALDIGTRIDNRLDLQPDDYLDLIMKKTCWYTTILPLRAGAIAGSRGVADLEPMIRFGFLLGAAFQIQDDILNHVADGGAYGKEALGDLLEGKRTLMLIHVLAAAGPEDRARLERFLAAPRHDRSQAEAAWVAERMDGLGSVSFARAFAAGIASEAETAFDAAFAGVPASPPRDFVRALIPFMVERTW
jgi:geranylgeranyl diphosphate synthase, type II